MKLKTKNTIQKDHLKTKDKFIDELLKSTYVMSQAMGMGGFNQLKTNILSMRNGSKGKKQSNSMGGTPDIIDFDKNEKMNSAAHNYFRQNFLEKGPYNILKLKKQVNQLKEIIHLKC